MEVSLLDQWGRNLINDPDPEKVISWKLRKRKETAEMCLELAELWACTLDQKEKEEYRSKFESYLWPYCLKNTKKQDISGWPYLIASILQIAASIEYDIIPEKLESSFVLKHCRDMENRVRIFTMVTKDMPCSIHGYFTRKHYINDQEEICGLLVENYLGKEFAWKIEKFDKIEGNSWMLSVVVSAIVRYFQNYSWPKRIGCTGVVDEHGRVNECELLAISARLTTT